MKSWLPVTIALALICIGLGVAVFVQSMIIETDGFVLALVAQKAGTPAKEIEMAFPGPLAFTPPFSEWVEVEIGSTPGVKKVFTYFRMFPTLQVVLMFDQDDKLIRVTWRPT